MEHVLLHLVGLKRPYCSNQEASVVPYLIRQLSATGKGLPGMMIDGAGNLHVDMRSTQDCRTLFVAHTDTVHGAGGINEFTQGARKLTAKGAPLGADDAAGIAILCAMIQHGVPGYYIFTRGEECGGVGSKHLATAWGDLLEQFDRAIAFDRKGTTDVITRQAACGKCCSPEFADALSDALNAHDGLMYMPMDTGVYTDTAEFTYQIPECTNISVGYYHEHTAKEWLDMTHWRALCAAACAIKWDELPTVRALDDDGWLEHIPQPRSVPTTTSKAEPMQDWYDAEHYNPDDDVNDPFYVGRCH
jgi:putative aminopeptidase FrvX